MKCVMKSKFLFILAAFWQLTWGILQSTIGLLVFLVNIGCPHCIYRGSLMTEWKRQDGVSLGLFAFVPKTYNEGLNEHLRRHEYGHCVQSMILGPLYLPVIGLPSLGWNVMPIFQRYRKRQKVNYEQFYTEAWANRLGGTRQW